MRQIFKMIFAASRLQNIEYLIVMATLKIQNKKNLTATT